ncbi:MAG: TRAP transporter small permease, partial [Desulfobacterales bacterium]
MFRKLLGFLDKVLTFFEEWTLFITVMVALASLFVNVVLRYGFNHSLAWSEELVREVIIYTTFIGCSAAVKNRSMIKIDASVQLLPKLKNALSLFSNFTILIFGALMIYYGWLMAALQVRTHQKTIILQIPLVYLYAVLPLMGAMMIIRVVQV